MSRGALVPSSRWSRSAGWLARAAAIVAALLMAFSSLIPAASAASGDSLLLPALIAFMVRTFWFHIGIGLIPFVVTALALRLRTWSIVGAILLAWTLFPFLWSLRPRSSTETDGPSLTLMSINLFFGNDDITSIKASIEHEDPDVVLLQEYTPQAAAKLDSLLRDRYPYVLDYSRDGAFGQAIFSRKPFIGMPDPFPHQSPFNEPVLPASTVAYNQPQIRVAVDVGGREVVIQNTHLPAPVSFQFFRDQRVWIQWLVNQAQVQHRPIIYAGDFNATQQSSELSALREVGLTSALDDSGWGRCATWPHQRWLKYVPGIRIDHFMSRGLSCDWARTGPATGSDHLPIVARFRVDPAARHE